MSKNRKLGSETQCEMEEALRAGLNEPLKQSGGTKTSLDPSELPPIPAGGHNVPGTNTPS